MGLRLTSSLNMVRNDTGRIAYCGPTVMSAITGYPVSRVEEIIHQHRADPAEARKIIVGTTGDEVRSALAVFSYAMDLTEDFMHLERKQRPTVWSWMQRPRSAFSFYVLGVHVRSEGHWICIKGAKICDTYTKGRWMFGADGPHRGARMMEVYRVRHIDESATRVPAQTDKTDGFAGRCQFQSLPEVSSAVAVCAAT